MSKHNFIHKALLLIACLMPHFAVWGQDSGSEFWKGDIKYRVLQNEQEVEVIGLNYRYGVYEIQIPSIVTVPATDWNNKTFTVTTIGDKAFRYCEGLISIHLPNSVTTIENNAFYSCSGLTSITVDSENTNYSSSNGVLFDKAQQLLIKCPEGKYGLYQIPNSVTTIGDSAFWSCDRLTSVNLPNSVTTIGNGAFNECYGLTSINLSNSVTRIGDEAFRSCRGLESIHIPNSVTTIGDNAFYRCERLNNITVDSENTNYSSSDGVLFDKAQQLLMLCPEGKNGVYQIPNSVTTIGDGAFSDCSGLESIHIPNSVTTIENRAFLGCSRLESIHIPNSVTTIGNRVFSYCYGLESIYIPNSVTTIGDYAFYYCIGLKSVNLPNSVTTIGDYAFLRCEGLTSIHIPNSVTMIGSCIFKGCSGLETLYFHSINPPTITDKYFGEFFTPQTIYVPQEAVATYQATEPYNRYNIQGMDESTGIGEVETPEAPPSGNIYDFNGRLVRTDGNLQALPKGIYILNGKKVVR